MNKTNKDYFTFNVHNTALLIGQTGSGKSELVRQYIRRLEKAYTPEKMQYVIYDLKQVEFLTHLVNGQVNEEGAKEEYLYSPLRTGLPEDMDFLEDLANLAEIRSKAKDTYPMLFIYIEECDMAIQYPLRFHTAVMKINRFAKLANMKLIFSTSRPSPDVITPDFRDSFDLILSGTLASEYDEMNIGIPGATSSSRYEFIVKEV